MSETATLEVDRQVEIDRRTDVDESEVDHPQHESTPPLKPVEALRDEQTQLEAWVHQSFAALERLHSDLDEWQQELTRQQADLDENLSNRLDSSEQILQLEKDLDRTEQERDQALQAVLQIEKALEQSQASLAENENHQRAFSEQLEQLQQQGDHVTQQLAQALQEVRQLEGKVHEMDELDRQYTAVQAELKAVREHAEQLSRSLESERHRAGDQQQNWSNELKEMRQLLDRQCDLMVRGSANEATQAPFEPEPEPVVAQTVEPQVMEAEVNMEAAAPLDPETRRSDEIRQHAKDRRAAKRLKRK
jgi:chromosome segregation ATPase